MRSCRKIQLYSWERTPAEATRFPPFQYSRLYSFAPFPWRILMGSKKKENIKKRHLCFTDIVYNK